MSRRRSVTGLAGDVDLGPGRLIASAAGVVSFGQTGRVAFGALVIPGLIGSGPMQRMIGSQVRLAAVEMEPALTA